MLNPLDKIYQEYKNNKGMPTDGVPNPLFDSELNTDDKTRACSKCGSLNVSFDLTNNKTVCNDCNENMTSPHKIDFSKKVNEIIENDLEKIQDALKRGDQIGFTN